MRKMRAVGIFLALGMVSGAFAAYEAPVGKLADRVVARVNAVAITLSEVEESALRRRIEDATAQRMDWRRLYDEELRFLIDEELLYQAAEREKIAAPEEVVAAEVEEAVKGLVKQAGSLEKLTEELAKYGMTVDRLKDDLRRREARDMIIARGISRRFSIGDPEVVAFEEDLRKKGKPTVSYRLRHILILCPSDAEAKQAEKAHKRAFEAAIAAQGKLSFEEAARKFSGDEATRDSGGDLGYVDEGMMMPVIEQAVRDLEPGKLSQPVRSDTGYHVFQLVRKRDARQMLFVERFTAERQKWLEELHRTETIETMFNFMEKTPGIGDFQAAK